MNGKFPKGLKGVNLSHNYEFKDKRYGFGLLIGIKILGSGLGDQGQNRAHTQDVEKNRV